MIQPKQCKQILENGQQCGAYAIAGSEYCFSHDPESRERHLIACKKGGSVKQIAVNHELQTVEVKTPTDVIYLLNTTIQEVRDGKLDPRIANTIGYLSSHLLKAYEIANIDEKVEEVRAVLIERKTRQGKRK